jgi:hypothetical protein
MYKKISETMFCMFLLLLLFNLVGCKNIEPVDCEYTFLVKEPYKYSVYQQVYGPRRDAVADNKLNVRLSFPRGKVISFYDNFDILLEVGKKYTITPRAGVYPFQILTPADGGLFGSNPEVMLSGAMIVYNTMGLRVPPTFGAKEGAEIFDVDLIKKALSGEIVETVWNFKGKHTMICWLGNRKTLYVGGEPSVEFDFSKNNGITALEIDGTEAEEDDKFCLLVESFLCKEENSGKRKSKDLPVRFVINQKAYAGYIRKIKDVVFTAFVKIPCKIPASLLKDADNGTVVELSIDNPDDDKDKVAEMIFSRTWKENN